MPPPKKPKTGTAWVQDFMSANEPVELKQKHVPLVAKKLSPRRMYQDKFKPAEKQECDRFISVQDTNSINDDIQDTFSSQCNVRKEAQVGNTTERVDCSDNMQKVISDNLVSSSKCPMSETPQINLPQMSKVCIVVSDEEENHVCHENGFGSKLKQLGPTDNSDRYESSNKAQSPLLLKNLLSSGHQLKKYSNKPGRRHNGVHQAGCTVLTDWCGDTEAGIMCGKFPGTEFDPLHEKRNNRHHFKNSESSTQINETPDEVKALEDAESPLKSGNPEERNDMPVDVWSKLNSCGDLNWQNKTTDINIVESTYRRIKRSEYEKATGGLTVRKVDSLMMRRQLESLMDIAEHTRPPTSKYSPVQCFPAAVQKVPMNQSPWEHVAGNQSYSADVTDTTLLALRENTLNNGCNRYPKITAMREQDSMENKSTPLILPPKRLFYKYLSTSHTKNYHEAVRGPVKDDDVGDVNRGPITKLENMCKADTTKVTNFDNSVSPFKNRSARADFPFLYQSHLCGSGSCDDKNKAPLLASSCDIMPNSGIALNVNNTGAQRPSQLLKKGVLNINESVGASTKRGISAEQKVNNNTSKMSTRPVNGNVQELTSSGRNENTDASHKRKQLLISVGQSTNSEKIPPLLPISNIMPSRKFSQMENLREPMDQEYEKQAMPSSSENNSLTTTHSNIAQISMGTFSATPYPFPPPNFTMSHGARTSVRSDSYPSNHPGTSSFLDLPAKDSSNAFRTVSCPSLVSIETKFTGPIPSPSVFTQSTISTHDKVDSGLSDSTITNGPSSVTENVSLVRNNISSNINNLDRQHSPSPPQRQMEVPSSTEDLKKKTTEDRAHGRRCQICNDNASGFHYGVWSCEGCKAFFKRSLQGPVDYVCPSTNTCTIDKQRRKSCQACRLRKCIETGMSRGNCRKERKSGVQRGPKRKSDSSDVMENMAPSESKLMRPDGTATPYLQPNSWDSVDSSVMGNQSSLTSFPRLSVSTSSHQPQCSPSSQPEQSSSSTSSSTSNPPHQHSPNSIDQPSTSSQTLAITSNSVGFGAPASSVSGSVAATAVGGGVNSNPGPSASSALLIQESSSISTSQLPVDPLVEHLLRIDPPLRALGHNSSQSETEVHRMTLLMRLADIELVDVINWAKSIPGYAELKFQDRVHLLELCWMEILILGILWHTMNNTENTQLGESFILASDLIFDRAKFEEVHMWHIGCQLQGYLQEMSNLHLNQEEFVLLRALVLINSDRSNSVSKEKISSLRGRILQALHYTVIERYHGTISKVMNLLTLLPHIRQLGQQWITHLVRSSRPEQLATYGLLKEMIDAYLQCVDCTYCENLSSEDRRRSQDSRSTSLESNGTISVSPSLSPQSDVNV